MTAIPIIASLLIFLLLTSFPFYPTLIELRVYSDYYFITTITKNSIIPHYMRSYFTLSLRAGHAL
jgi:hypothetical protein